MHAQPPPPVSSATPPGWYADPWSVAPWRWWDGAVWTGHISGSTERKPRLPAWLSVPVLIATPLVLLSIVVILVTSPESVLLSVVPLVIVLPTLWWLDRVEPEPRGSLIHSFLWGATVAVLISGIANALVAFSVGIDTAAVTSAPIVEEATKGLGIYWAIRRRELDSMIDGVIYAGWVAVGFAAVENMQYFSLADASGQLLAVFIVRGLITPFVHPLFTFWIGLAAGWAIERGKSVVGHMVAGYLLAAVLHAAWNGTLISSAGEGALPFAIAAGVAFLLLFLAVVVALYRVHHRDRSQFLAMTPMLVQRYQLSAGELDIFSDWSRLLATRRRLSKPERRQFDRVHAALARLAHFHGRSGAADPADEKRLVAALREARSGDASRRIP